MKINGINGASTQIRYMGMDQATDAHSRSIQDQIANAQQQLQELSSNEHMTPEEKMKRRQEIQQQISDLNMQLRQHQIEQRRAAMNGSEKQQAKGSSMDDMAGGTGNAKAGSKSAGLSQASMTAMLSADNSIKVAKVQGSVATKMEGRSGILRSEIKLEQARGGDTQKKEEELAEVSQKAQAAGASQLSSLADASRTMEEAAEADSREEKEDKDAKVVNGKDVDANVSDTDERSADTRSDVPVSSGAAAAKAASEQRASHVSVDIRL